MKTDASNVKRACKRTPSSVTTEVLNCQGACASCPRATAVDAPPALQRLPMAPAQAQPTVLDLSPAAYPGGIAMWGALPAVYNTSNAPDEFGVHVHARMKVGGRKSIDETFDFVRVEVPGKSGDLQHFTVNGEDASRYNVATILGVRLTYLRCPSCGNVHSDEDYALVHPHSDHVCESCNFGWTTEQACVSNPVMLLKECCGDELQNRIILDPVERNVNQPQNRFPGGIQIWGSNPAIVWTSPKPEEGGLHFHAFLKQTEWPDVDETYGTVTLDGFGLDAEQVRHLMAQRALPFLNGRIASLSCPECTAPHLDSFAQAVAPHSTHHCAECGHHFPSQHDLGEVSNPVIASLAQLEKNWQDGSDQRLTVHD